MCGLYIVGIHFDLLFSSTLLPSAISMASHPVYITWSLVVFVVGCIIRVYTRCIYPESILPVCNWWWSCEWVWMKQAMVRCTYLVVGREGNARRWFARWARRGDVVGFRFHSRSLHAKSTTAKITHSSASSSSSQRFPVPTSQPVKKHTKSLLLSNKNQKERRHMSYLCMLIVFSTSNACTFQLRCSGFRLEGHLLITCKYFCSI